MGKGLKRATCTLDLTMALAEKNLWKIKRTASFSRILPKEG